MLLLKKNTTFRFVFRDRSKPNYEGSGGLICIKRLHNMNSNIINQMTYFQSVWWPLTVFKTHFMTETFFSIQRFQYGGFFEILNCGALLIYRNRGIF